MPCLSCGLQASKTLVAFLLALLALTILCGCDSAQQAENPRQANIPQPIYTAIYPTTTAAPTIPYYTPTPLPPPPIAATFPPAAEPVPNIVWSAQGDTSLTIWVGHYSDSPAPAITGARPIARWTGMHTDLASAAASPDGHSLAVLLPVICVPEPPPPTATPGASGLVPPGPDETNCEGSGLGSGISPQYIYAIDLTTNKIQVIPDYNRHYQLYADNVYYATKILGWFDNSRFGVTNSSSTMLTATKDGSSFIARSWPNLSLPYGVFSMALLPDHKTIFAWVGDNFFFRDAPTGEVHKVGDRIAGTSMDYMAPSPNGKLVYSLEPPVGATINDSRHYGLWTQDLASGSRTMLIDGGVWDVQPAWSPDSSRIAFAHTDNVPYGDNIWVGQWESVNTNIYVADVAAHSTRQLTSFAGAHNSGIQWTPEGNLVLSSSAGNSTGAIDLAAISPSDGKLTVLVSATQDEKLLRPLLFGPESPGMPRTGAGTK